MMQREELTGLVLAGGQGRRMQPIVPGAGSVLEKGLLELEGLPLVEHARRRLLPYVEQVFISANTRLDAYANYGTVIPDDTALEAYSGPLAGVASALRHVATPWLLVLPVDVPRPPADLIPRLCARVGMAGAKLAYACTAAGVHPLCMVLHSSLVDGLYDFLLAGERKVQFWQRQNGAVPVLFDGVGDTFFNINTLEDLGLARGSE